MPTPPPPNLPTPPSGDPLPKIEKKNPYLPPNVPPAGIKVGEGFDIPDPFAAPVSAPTPVPTPPPAPAKPAPQVAAAPKVDIAMPAKTSQPNPIIAPQVAAAPAPLAPPAFRQEAQEQHGSRRWIFITMGIFIAILLIVAIAFAAYTLLSTSSNTVPDIVIPTEIPATATPDTFATASPSSTPLASVAPIAQDTSDVGDPDEDGLTNAEERFYGTDAANADTDADEFKDGEEVRNGYNPLGEGKLDSDNDGFPDPDERKFGTDPFNPDTDSDGYSDGDEITAGYNPLIASPNDKL